MGLESVVRVTQGGLTAESKVQLETDFIAARGEVRFRIPFDTISQVNVRDGILEIVHTAGRVLLNLGQDSEKWAHKIRNPKKLIDKLGVKADSLVSVLRVTDDAFWEELTARTTHIFRGTAAEGSDFIFVLVAKPADLDQFTALRSKLAPAGAIWAVWAKGKGQPVAETDVIAAGKASGLVDVKVARFSDTLSALKLVIPVEARKHVRARVQRA